MTNIINNGQPTNRWNGISHTTLLARCEQATPEEAAAMSTAASLMLAGECSTFEWDAAMVALASVERRLCAEWEAQHGAPRCNRNGRILGGEHPALRPDLYAEALANLARG